MTPALPNLIIIGANKCGTTALHHYLGHHPEIAMSSKKELNFFSRDEWWSLGVDWYGSQFDAEASVRGESSPSYTDRGRYPNAARRLTVVVPDARLIYLVRDPVHRIVADYVHRVSAEQESRTWSAFLDSVEGTAYLDRSCYFWQLQPYVECIPAGKLLVLAQEHLRNDRRRTLQKVFRFVGVDDSFWSPFFDRQIHETSKRRRRTSSGRFVARLMNPLLKRLPGDRRYQVERVLYLPISRPVTIPGVDRAVRSRLLSLLQDDIVQFARLLGSSHEVSREAMAWLERE